MSERDSTDSLPVEKPFLKKAKSAPAKKKLEKPEKPYKDFPLFPHDSRQWAKKVRGKMHYFGSWNDPIAARDKWLDQKDDLLAGRIPREAPGDGLTVKRLIDLALESREAKVDTGERTRAHFEEMKSTALVVAEFFGRTTLVEQLRPNDFQRLRAKLGKGVALKSLEGRIARVRALFHHGSKNGLIDVNMAKLWGTEFEKPEKSSIALQRGDRERLFTREEILTLIELASPQLKAMILLGINGGYGNTDCAMIEEQHIANGWLTKIRQKTSKKRRTPLWPETQKAIADVLGSRPEPKDAANASRVFLTKYGNTWTPNGKDNPVSKEFAKLVKEAKITGSGKSFYSLRHTFQTIGDETKDFVCVSALMGHYDDSISGEYRERISDERRIAVTDHVRQWLYPAAATPKSASKKRKGGA